MRRLLLAASLLVAGNAAAQEAQVAKAREAVEAFRGGDANAQAVATAALEKALAHKDTGSAAATWVVKGQLDTAIALKRSVPDPAAIEAAVTSWEGAAERGAAADAMAPDITRILAATTLVVRDDLEGKRIDDAWRRVDAAMRGRATLKGAGWSDERAEGPMLELATLTAVRAGKLEPAATWFADWRALGTFEPGIAVQLASALAAANGVDAGVAFLDPLLEERPHDEAMLGRVVELLVTADRAPDALARVQAAAKKPGAEGTGPSLVLAPLFVRAGDPAAGRAAYEAALARSPDTTEAWVPLANLLIDAAIARSAAIKTTKGRSAIKALDAERRADLDRARELLEKASAAAGGTPGRPVLEALVRVYSELGMEEARATAEKGLQSVE